MTALIHQLRQSTGGNIGRIPPRFWWAMGGIGLLLALASTDVTLQGVIFETLAEAYLAVSTFVALTLGLLYLVERLAKFDTVAIMERHGVYQVPIAALLGALPGCGGAIIVATQYATGRLRFGALLAALTATMGDAAFLLLAREPLTGLGVFALGAVVGAATGMLVDALHGDRFMRPARDPLPLSAVRAGGRDGVGPFDLAWLALIVPGIFFGVAGAAQVEFDIALAGLDVVTTLGVVGAVLAVAMWTLGSGHGHGAVAQGAGGGGNEPWWRGAFKSVQGDTNFVTVWVVLAFLVYEVPVHVLSIDLAALFAAAAPIVPLLAILVGFLPGCGPQIVVTSLYLTGAIPLSALLGNVISNDGDALIPAMALAPKAAVVATLYSAVPALIVAYGVVAFTAW